MVALDAALRLADVLLAILKFTAHGPHPIRGQRNAKKGNSVGRWRCALCRYGYDAAEGDRENGRVLGITFEDLPDDWVCAEWGTGKAMFQEAEE